MTLSRKPVVVGAPKISLSRLYRTVHATTNQLFIAASNASDPQLKVKLSGMFKKLAEVEHSSFLLKHSQS